MVYLFGKGLNVSVIMDEKYLTEVEINSATLILEHLPEPESIEGKTHVYFIDPVTKEFSYKYIDIINQLSKEEKLQALVDAGKITQEEMNEVL